MRSRRTSSSTGTAGAPGGHASSTTSSPSGQPGRARCATSRRCISVAVGESAVGAQRLAPGGVELRIGGREAAAPAQLMAVLVERDFVVAVRQPQLGERHPGAGRSRLGASAGAGRRPASSRIVARTRSRPTVAPPGAAEARAQRLGNADRERHLDAGAPEVAPGRHRASRRERLAVVRQHHHDRLVVPTAAPQARRAGARAGDPRPPGGSGRRPLDLLAAVRHPPAALRHFLAALRHACLRSRPRSRSPAAAITALEPGDGQIDPGERRARGRRRQPALRRAPEQRPAGLEAALEAELGPRPRVGVEGAGGETRGGEVAAPEWTGPGAARDGRDGSNRGPTAAARSSPTPGCLPSSSRRRRPCPTSSPRPRTDRGGA